MQKGQIIGIIPARYGSSRFPGKPLVDINGRSMILRVCDQARKAGVLQEILVATDDNRIFDHVLEGGYRCVMTSPDHRSGTDRCLEALDAFSSRENLKFDYVINIQGDEPFLPPEHIRQVAGLLMEEDARIASLVRLIDSQDQLFDPNVVKAVFGNDYQALYFSRHPLPYLRNVEESGWLARKAHYKHIGIYGFQVDILRQVCQLPVGRLEEMESLEQLRWLEAGYSIQLGVTDLENISIDTPGDLLKISNKD
jgi:3-deoxy-manno-octulosonate cytidylyltransferase (CMP-KDO synthetase)